MPTPHLATAGGSPRGTVDLRRLGPADARALRALRIRAVREHPEAFFASEAEEERRTVEDFASQLHRDPELGGVFGAFLDGELVGMLGLAREEHEKGAHRAVVWGMYVAAEARGHGAGRALLRAVEEGARTIPGLCLLHLMVTRGNESARRLYVEAGYRSHGIEIDVVRVDGRSYDEERMVLILHSAGRVRAAAPQELAAIQQIERAACALFEGHGDLADRFRASPTPAASVEAAIAEGRAWIVELCGPPVAFAIAKAVDGAAYLVELDVDPRFGRRGFGRALVERTCQWARDAGLDSVTLSTQRSIPWNAPFYAKLGFAIIEESMLSPGLLAIRERERASGFRDDRVMMRKRLGG